MVDTETTSEQVAVLELDVLPRLMRLVATSAGLREPGQLLSTTQVRILKRLVVRPWLGSELAHELRVTPPTVSAAIDSLVRRGLVERGEAEDDRRAVPLRLTPSGARCFERTKERALATLQSIADQIGPEERHGLALGLSAIAGILDSQSAPHNCNQSLTIEDEG
ncbi:MAG TPA: MarR family transcriptional regulator [Chloroflexota bacterium]|nr:MarR family transcriptional regulator [Chloroflexota bacterium]